MIVAAPAIPANSIKFTGYVDAIQLLIPIPLFAFAERRKPPGSPVHLNQYQTDDIGLHGAETDEDLDGVMPQNVNRNSEVHFALQGPHIQIDLLESVIDKNVEGILNNLPDR